VPNLQFSKLNKVSSCTFELDTHYQYIINQHFVDERTNLEVLQILKEFPSSEVIIFIKDS
jgi:hypothetical protein